MDKQPECVLTRSGEAKLRQAFGLLRSWTPNGLADRLRQDDIGVSTHNAARILISNGYTTGLLLRTGGKGEAYTLNADWQHPAGPLPPKAPAKAKPAPRPKRLTAFQLLGQIPAQRPGPLVASLGARGAEGVDADGELLPCVGGRIVDALHSQFQSIFAGADR